MSAAVTTDDIYKRYLDKAIKEILRLEHEVAEAAAGAPVAQPTGHPLGTIFLLKYGPQAPELQEGVAFHGRAGHALKKSLERLTVDAAEVFGTNCVKFAGAGDETCRAWLRRELRIVQPKLVVAMGEDALDFLVSAEVPLSRPVTATLGELQQFSPTI
ncbi:MAG TPA: uracil-DNA glycosylase family protein, partial [Gaiellaceae bacterium]|nr:uracil-DNA glycosylase family protein [Gaiellaceae bacterium]